MIPKNLFFKIYKLNQVPKSDKQIAIIQHITWHFVEKYYTKTAGS